MAFISRVPSQVPASRGAFRVCGLAKVSDIVRQRAICAVSQLGPPDGKIILPEQTASNSRRLAQHDPGV